LAGSDEDSARIPVRFIRLLMNKPGRCFVALCMSPIFRTAILSFLLAPALTAAPAWRKELTSPEPGPFAKPAASVIDMRLSWRGMINSGNIRIEFAPPDLQKPGTYLIRSTASSTGPASIAYPYKSNFLSEINPRTLRPRGFQAIESAKKASTTTANRYFADRVESHCVTRAAKTGLTKETRHAFPISPGFDIFSAMLHIRSQKLATGDRHPLVIHPFANPYLLRVKVVGREVHNGRSAIRLSVGMQKIDRKTQELQAYKKLKQDAILWLSDDADRVPLEFRAAVFIGDVRATLTGHHKY
jgi:hypothetical protein